METTHNHTPKEKNPFLALAIDGGGMRGFYSVNVAQALLRKFNGAGKDQDNADLGKKCNLICGASTGSILACGLATNITLDDLAKLYRDTGRAIFPNPLPSSRFYRALWGCRHLCRPSADGEKLREVLRSSFGDETLGMLYERRGVALCIPAVNAETCKAWVFKTPHIAGKERDNNYLLSDICRASCATPVLFSPHRITNPDNPNAQHVFVDGGLWSNNSVLMALVESLDIASPTQDINIIAIGTSSPPVGNLFTQKKANWGLSDWSYGIKIIEMSISSQSYGYDSIAKLISKNLSSEKRSVAVVRLAETPQSAERNNVLRLDRADQSAINTMANMAEEDANTIYGNCQNENDYKIIKSFFSNSNKGGENGKMC